MTLEGTRSGETALVAEADLQGACDRANDVGVEVHQVRVVGTRCLGHADAVWVVTGRAWCAFVDDVAAVIGKALIGENAGSLVALVTEGVIEFGFRRVVDLGVVAFEHEFVGRTVRAVRAVAAGARACVVVVAVGTADDRAAGDPRGQADRIAARRRNDNRVEAGIRRTEFEPQVGVLDLARDVASNSHGRVRMALETDLIFVSHLGYERPRHIDTARVFEGGADPRIVRAERFGGDRVRIVAIFAFDVDSLARLILHGVVDALVIAWIMRAELVEFGQDVGACHLPVMAYEAVFLLLFVDDQPLVAACRVRAMAASAGVLGNRAVRPVNGGDSGNGCPGALM